MLEIFGIVSLCKLNRRNAIARGRRPGLFIALTIILWVGMELLGFFVGSFLEIEYGSVFIAYGFAGLGALGSFLIAKFAPKGNYVDPNTNPVVRTDPNDPDSMIDSLTADEAKALLASGAIVGGMIPKIQACLETIERGVEKIHIINGRLRHSLLLEIFTSQGVGTQIIEN